MLINPIYKAGGGSPTPSSGYVEEGLLLYYEGNEEKLSFFEKERIVTATQFPYAPTINSTDGWTYEAYFEINGSAQYSYQGIFGISGIPSSKHIDFYIGEISNNKYKINPFFEYGGSADEVIDTNSILDNKYTIQMVSVPNADGVTANAVYFYLNEIQVGQVWSQSRDATMALSQIGIENSSFNPRPINGKLYNGRFYTRALTSAELAANHANDVAKYGGNG